MLENNRPTTSTSKSSPKSGREGDGNGIAKTNPNKKKSLDNIEDDETNLSFTSSDGGSDNLSLDDTHNPANALPLMRRNPSFILGGHEIVLESAVDEEKEAEEDIYLIRLLARRAMHLPNMNWWQDWVQYLKNNHPLIGLFFHHEKHPLRVGHRLYILLSSVAFGLAATNCVYLYYAYNNEEMDKILVDIVLDEHPLNFKKIEALEVTYGMVALWTFGGVVHTVFDICMWYLSACACFLSGASCSRRGRYQLIGGYIVIALSAMFSALALFVVLMRAAYDRRLRLAEQGIVLEEFEWEELGRIRNFSFLIGYGVELALVYFVWYPILITALFVGALPFIGRTREMSKQYRERQARETKYRIYDEIENV